MDYYANIKDIAEEKNFYKIGNQNFEESFQNTENAASPIIKNLSKYKKTKPLDNIKNRSKLSIFMAIQFFRTNEMRKTILEQNSKISRYLKSFNMSEDMNNFVDFLDEKNIKQHQIEIIHELTGNLTYELFFKKWVLLKNKTEIDLWTSDNPIVRYNPHGNIGFSCEHIHIFYPINPKLCLCLVDPTNYSNFEELKKFQGNEMISNIHRAVSKNIKDSEKIEFINRLQGKYATRHIFSKNKNFDEIPNMIKNKIIIPNAEKERVLIEILKNPKTKNDIIHLSHPR